jgi:hypothetical protein
MSRSQSAVIACNLDVLSAAERDRRAALAEAVVAQAHSVQELTDGYALQLPVTSSLAHESLEWLLLDRRCCSFFRLELELEPRGAPSGFGSVEAPGSKSSFPPPVLSRGAPGWLRNIAAMPLYMMEPCVVACAA